MTILMGKQSQIKSFWFLFLFFAIGTAGCNTSGCKHCTVGNEITVPTSDSTPPTAGMDVNFPNGSKISVSSTSSPATSTVGGNDVVTLIAAGQDPEGEKDIQIWVEETWWFTDPATGTTTQQGPGLLGAPEQSNPDNASPGDTGCSDRLTSLNLDIKQRRKQATSYRVRTWATAVNFSGTQVKTADATLNWP